MKICRIKKCHPERSEGSRRQTEMLRFAQHDTGYGIGNWQADYEDTVAAMTSA